MRERNIEFSKAKELLWEKKLKGQKFLDGYEILL